MRSAEVQRAERAWLTRELTGGRTGLDAAWVALVLGEITRLRRLSERLLMIAATPASCGPNRSCWTSSWSS